jgi:two-component system sensor histidine kinase/response regulator
MYSAQSSIFSRNLPSETFEQLCYLWQQMADLAGSEAILIGEESLPCERAPGDDPGKTVPKERFRILVSPKLSALLLGKPLEDDLVYQVSLTFELQVIADFLSQLKRQLEKYPQLQELLQKSSLLQISKGETNLQSQFSLQLLGILVPAQPDISLTEIPIACFSSYQPVEMVLRNRLEQERILNQVTLQISQNLDWLVIVKMTIEQVQQLLQIDRLAIYQLNVKRPHQERDLKTAETLDAVTYEARASENIPSILYFQDETCFNEHSECRDKYRQGFTLVVDDLEFSNLPECLQALMQRLQVRAKIVTPIVVQNQLWGFLIAHQCFGPRHWKQSEVKFLLQIAQYLAIAIYQAQSYQQLQEQKNTLESLVNKRAVELRDALLAAQAASQSKSEFIGNMSHELLTPLTCIIGLSSTLLHWSLNRAESSLPIEKQRQYLQTIHDSGKHLLDLVKNILDFAQVEAGKSVLNIRELSLRQLSRFVVQSIQQEAIRHEINLELDFEVESSGDRFWADRERVEQILLNLLSNGIKFTPAGGQVTLRVWREERCAVFQVEDSGIGISEHQLPMLFETFQQLDPSRHRSYSGAGLGLALTKQLIELHQGRIEVESIVDNGSIFTVWLPDQQDRGSKQKEETKKLATKGRTIVLVTEDEDIGTFCCELLTAANYQVIWSIDSTTTIDQIQLLEPTVVILDRQFVRERVEEISQNLKKAPKTRYVKTLVLSNNMTLTDWEYLSTNGVDDYLLKPLQPSQLLRKINSSIS